MVCAPWRDWKQDSTEWRSRNQGTLDRPFGRGVRLAQQALACFPWPRWYSRLASSVIPVLSARWRIHPVVSSVTELNWMEALTSRRNGGVFR
jgi:hypothetical protein